MARFVQRVLQWGGGGQGGGVWLLFQRKVERSWSRLLYCGRDSTDYTCPVPAIQIIVCLAVYVFKCAFSLPYTPQTFPFACCVMWHLDGVTAWCADHSLLWPQWTQQAGGCRAAHPAAGSTPQWEGATRSGSRCRDPGEVPTGEVFLHAQCCWAKCCFSGSLSVTLCSGGGSCPVPLWWLCIVGSWWQCGRTTKLWSSTTKFKSST